MAIKRSREEIEIERTIAMANYLILLSRTSTSASMGPSNGGRVYECKTCNRQFPSFQALGGHRASHKKPRLSNGDADHHSHTDESAQKRKIHECSICGLEFPIGQALGGHMRRHRAAFTRSQHLPCSSPTLSLSLEASSHSHNVSESSGVSKSRASSNDDNQHGDHKRVVCLDLNLTPMENGLLEFGKLASVVC